MLPQADLLALEYLCVGICYDRMNSGDLFPASFKLNLPSLKEVELPEWGTDFHSELWTALFYGAPNLSKLYRGEFQFDMEVRALGV